MLKNRYLHTGFQLLELLITLFIISILTAFSIPLYSQYITHAKRLEAAAALTKLAIAMESYHIENNSYQGATLDNLPFSALAAKNNYQLVIQANKNDYALLAIPMDSQAKRDTKCGILILRATGEKSVSGTSDVDACW